MSATVAIADYGIGNLMSASRAFQHVGAEASLVRDPDQLRKADRVVVPGVGAFGDCVRALTASGLREAVMEVIAAGRPVLGICVGMQMLFDHGDEFGGHAGLGVIPGRVSRIPDLTLEGAPLKIPHIGWTALEPPREANDPALWEETILRSTPVGTPMYFVHSFTVIPENWRHRLADAHHGGQRIAAVVRKDNVSGAQFHPEKSGPAGLRLIADFVR
ncbi:imidazole glycerol phosphate synthase subunit HisH 1 [Alsobacter metallidurans]|uniref:Imidazole glycerol phosphate synthase subunit HisH n=1 Tax=Alsobacter metallidurans TaxID=340221 RepID=A0A917I6C3_9HYPH|nr:imidazole glycerol phosphate synthase subunit HisH [Alsobacter metallidurans]GGH15544.1 imidazole glycerol phosphate synthase subunit HisH 1 [Alsobacter metallidurans]